MTKSKGFVDEIKSLNAFPFDLSVEVGEIVKLPDLRLTENISVPMYGSPTIEETIAMSNIKTDDIAERIYLIVLIFLRSRSHKGWTMDHVKSLGTKLLLIAFNAFSKEMAAVSPNVESEKKEIPTGLLSIGDFVLDTQAIEDLTPTNSDAVL